MQFVRHRRWTRRRPPSLHLLDCSTSESADGARQQLPPTLHRKLAKPVAGSTALRTLDEVTREAARMKYFENLTSKEIGERLRPLTGGGAYADITKRRSVARVAFGLAVELGGLHRPVAATPASLL